MNEVESETLLPHTRTVLFTAHAMHDAKENDDDNAEEEEEEEGEEDHAEEFSRRIAGGETQDEDAAAPSQVMQYDDQAVHLHLVKSLKSTLFSFFSQ